MSNLIIFDLDGVITSEEAYWDAAGLTLYELCYSPRYWGLSQSALNTDVQFLPPKTASESRRISRSIFPESDILALKGRSINSNWDTCYVAVCLNLIFLLRLVSNRDALFPMMPWDASWLTRIRKILREQQGFGKNIAVVQQNRAESLNSNLELENIFGDQPFQGSTGLELINCLDAFAEKTLEVPITNVFSRYSPFWAFCRNIFQEWYLGDALFVETYGHAPAQSGKTGCIYFEKPLLPLDQISKTLETLCGQGYVLGFATGRVYREAIYPLKMYELFEYFQEQHISTYDDVERAEAELRSLGDKTLLSKPHPFPFLLAKGKNLTNKDKLDSFIVVGDSTSDILGGREAGAMTVAVLTGTRTPEARKLLDQSNPDFTIADITKLPELLEQLDSLATIQKLQFKDCEKAELLMQRWLAQHMNVMTENVTLTPKAVSLNSFNGFYRSDGQEFFFKTHVEEQGILKEYYNAEQLYQAGYNIVRPLRTMHHGGQQMVIYPVVRWPVMFDLVRGVEVGDAEDGIYGILIDAEKYECSRMLDIYQTTFAISTATEHSNASIHQLFWHRLVGGRYKSFYEGKSILYPTVSSQLQEESISFNELLSLHWVINGVPMQKTLGELVERARVILDPAQSALTVIGHGDAHYGNVFLENQHKFLYFDPAFAGRHSPLLDIIKPLFHNVFAAWMYFPDTIAHDLQLTVVRDENTIIVENNYTLTPIRKAILQTKNEHLLKPLIAHMQERGMLPIYWKEIMQLAMMCCPLLTINLLDRECIPTSICWLGLLQAVQTGNQGIKPWENDL